jgi:hypothetical protein
VFVLLEVQEGDGCGDMNLRVEICCSVCRYLYWYGLLLNALFYLAGSCELVLDWIDEHGKDLRT